MWDLKNIQMDLFTKQTNSQTQKANLWLPKGKEGMDKCRGMGLTDKHHYI